MEARYDKGQKVKIVSVKDKQGNVKYPHNEKYVDEVGVVLDSFYLGAFHVLYYRDHLPEDAYIYKVHLGMSNTVVTAAEEELQPCP
ncbi:MAG: hypothetical protein PHY18_06205 [Dehalococcoidales bacterium]|nr:hypothetical protein [Dehalococcoidales bacterium]